MLDGKDREELHTIAGAMGVKARDPHAQGRPDRRDPRRRQRRRRRAGRGRRPTPTAPRAEAAPRCARRARRELERRLDRRARRRGGRARRGDDAADDRRRARPRRARRRAPRRRDRRVDDRRHEPPTRSDERRARADAACSAPSTRRRPSSDAATTPVTRRRARRRRRRCASTPTTSGSRSATATAAAAVAVAAAAVRSSGGGEPRQRRVPGRPDRGRRACSTCATRATASSAPAATSPVTKDVYVSASQVRRFALRKGDFVQRHVAPAGEQREVPGAAARRRHQRHDARRRAQPSAVRGPHAAVPRLEAARSSWRDDPHEITGRIVDLISPIGKGQRGLIVSPPKAGKTTILKQIVYSIERNNPEVHLMVLLVDERPEEVTDMRRHVLRGEVVASTFDRPVRRAHPGRRARDRAGEAARRDGHRRRHRARRHHPPRARVQPRGADVGPDHVGWCRLHRAVPAEEVLRCGPQHRGGRLAHDHRDRARSRPAAGWTR